MSKSTRFGKIAELKFNTICIELGLACLWPSIDIHGYDCIIDSNGRLFRIQIKSCANIYTNNRGYEEIKFSLAKGKGSKSTYDVSDFDFLACYSHKLDQWWIIPMEDTVCVNDGRGFSVYPRRKNSKYTKFQNAWHLLH